ncbi:hypothetical protein [Tropicimonas sp. IMCC34043]|uniref:hypothetical protein n=1 Tax=Tropicimonas sp. IMCC34043 TaxID=2248760 RepID=UPI000E28629F|nr:hypothetical protein [Tropicimonas sp. IMCC34043]
MKRLIPLVLLLLLAACVSPRQACLQQATRDVAVLEGLIAEVEGNLARGYAIRQEPYVTSGLDLCLGSGYGAINGGLVGVGWGYCNQVETRYRAVPVPIDRVSEQRKLAELKQSRAKATTRAELSLKSCEAQFPLG